MIPKQMGRAEGRERDREKDRGSAFFLKLETGKLSDPTVRKQLL